jgi:hypothetical protein
VYPQIHMSNREDQTRQQWREHPSPFQQKVHSNSAFLHSVCGFAQRRSH